MGRIYSPDALFEALKGIIDLPDGVVSLDIRLRLHEIPTLTIVCEAQKDVPHLEIVKYDQKEFKFRLERIYD